MTGPSPQARKCDRAAMIRRQQRIIKNEKQNKRSEQMTLESLVPLPILGEPLLMHEYRGFGEQILVGVIEVSGHADGGGHV